jgi:hypothetical protein
MRRSLVEGESQVFRGTPLTRGHFRVEFIMLITFSKLFLLVVVDCCLGRCLGVEE